MRCRTRTGATAFRSAASRPSIRGGRRDLGGRRRLRHLLRRAAACTPACGAAASSCAAERAGRSAVSPAYPPGVGSTGRCAWLDAQGDGRDAAGGARWAVERATAARGPRPHRGARLHGGADPAVRLERAPAPARRDGHARFGQPLPRGAARRGKSTTPPRRRLRPRRRRRRGQHPLRLARPRPPDRHRVPAGDGRRAAHGIACRTASWPARRPVRRSASAISAPCAPPSTARWPTGRSSPT
jgi:hypothetical protein